MSKKSSNIVIIEANELNYKKGFSGNELIEGLTRFLAEALPKLKITLNGTDIEIEKPERLSKRAIKLRIKKYLYKKGIDNDYRAIALLSPDKEGYTIKEKKILELAYY